MGWMSYDICFCGNKSCERKDCARHSDRLKNWPWPVSMAGFQPDEDGNCEHFVELEQPKPKKKGKRK